MNIMDIKINAVLAIFESIVITVFRLCNLLALPTTKLLYIIDLITSYMLG